MTLSEQQRIFARNIALLLPYILKSGYEFTLGEVFRSPLQAEYNAAHNIGIKNSLHCQRLAIDINLFKDNKYLTQSPDYYTIGTYWKSLHILNRWGGDFKDRPDGNHMEMQLFKG